MNWLRNLRGRVRALFRKEQLDGEMAQEMRSHIEMQMQENIEAGMEAEEARFDALRRFGWTESIQEACREQRGVRWLETLVQDIRFGARQLRKNPGFTTVALLTMVLGIGANTAVFSLVNAVLLRPLPYPDSGQLIELKEVDLRDPARPELGVSGPNFLDWRANSRSFASMGLYAWGDFWLADGGESRQVRGLCVTADLFPTFGVPPLLGRGFQPQDERASGVVLLGYELWQRFFGGDTNIVGRTVVLNEQRQTVVGIMPPSFSNAFDYRPELWTPLLDSSDLMRHRDNHLGWAIGRLKPGVSLRQGQAEMDVLARQLGAQYPAEDQNRGVRVASLHGRMTRAVRPALLALFGGVGLLLLIMCANLGNLMLARAMAREKELAIRAALGAGRGRLLRQLLTEVLVLSVLGGATGLLAVLWSRSLLSSWMSSHLPPFVAIRIDAAVWLFALVAAVLTGLFCVLVPAWRIRGVDLNQALREGSQCNTSNRAGAWHRSLFVVCEIALAMVLLIGAGLTLRSLYYALHTGLECDPANLLLVELQLPRAHYPMGSPQRSDFFEQLVAGVKALPGVQAAATSFSKPFGGVPQTSIVLEGRPANPGEPAPSAGMNIVSPDFFQTMGLRLLQGRTFTREDRKGAPGVVVIDQAMARRYWPGEAAIGKAFAWGQGSARGPRFTVVGVVTDLRTGGSEGSRPPNMYYCCYQMPAFLQLLVRASPDAMRVVAPLQSLAHGLDKSVSVENVQTLNRFLNDMAADVRLRGELLACFAALALVLAGVGIYGVVSYAATQRTHEFGVRLALGARRADLLKLVVGWGFRLAVTGIAIGLGLAWGTTRLMISLLNGVRATDPATFAIAAAFLLTIALVASWLPGRRAAQVDPIVALRHE
jgi:putative ABC transport system permease protein